MLFFEGSFLCSTFRAFFYYCFFFFWSWLCPFLQNSNSLFWVCLSTFLCFVLLCSDLKVVFKRTIYAVIKLVLIRFVYRGFSFLSHAVRLWFVVFSKLRWLVWIII